MLERTQVKSYYCCCCRTNSIFMTKTEQNSLPNKILLALVHDGGIKRRKKIPTNLGLTVQVPGTACEIPGVLAPGSFHTQCQPREGRALPMPGHSRPPGWLSRTSSSERTCSFHVSAGRDCFSIDERKGFQVCVLRGRQT